jgi:Uma2 family endonuclease
MIRLPWLSQPLTEEQVRQHFMLTLEDDTEEKPWMVMGDLQFWSASSFAHSLRIYSRDRQLGWYVASMLPILYTWPGVVGKKQLAPDAFVAFVDDHPRQIYDVEIEGSFPPFILEVVSPSSSARDEVEKRQAYEALGALEYALFTPRDGAPSLLEGYRRAPSGRFEPWSRDESGRMTSEVLGLTLVVNGSILQAETADGQLLMTPDQLDAAWREAEAARDEEARARREVEAELKRLREELDRRRLG